MSKSTFLSRFEEAMAAAGVSRSAIADHLGTAKSTITRWSHGAIPRAEIIDAIAKRCGVSTFWLATGGGQMERKGTAPAANPSQAIGLTEAERMILIRALTASAEKWRGMAERLRFESEGTVWADAAYAAEKLLLKIAP